MSAPGRAAVVTGAARGIGRATAVALAKNGFRVALADIRGPEMQVTAALVREAGSEARAREGAGPSLAPAQRPAYFHGEQVAVARPPRSSPPGSESTSW